MSDSDNPFEVFYKDQFIDNPLFSGDYQEPAPGTLARVIKRIRAVLDGELPAFANYEMKATPEEVNVRFFHYGIVAPSRAVLIDNLVGPSRTPWMCAPCNTMVYSASCPMCQAQVSTPASGGPPGRQVVVPNPSIIQPDRLKCCGPCGSTIRIHPGLPLGDPWDFKGRRLWLCTHCKNQGFPKTCAHFGIRLDANGDLDEIYCHGCSDVLWERTQPMSQAAINQALGTLFGVNCTSCGVAINPNQTGGLGTCNACAAMTPQPNCTRCGVPCKPGTCPRGPVLCQSCGHPLTGSSGGQIFCVVPTCSMGSQVTYNLQGQPTSYPAGGSAVPTPPDCPTCQGPMLLISSTGSYACQNTQCPNTQVVPINLTASVTVAPKKKYPVGFRIIPRLTPAPAMGDHDVTPEELERNRAEARELNRPRCTKCKRGLSSTLDAYYGQDPEQEKRCSSCRT